MNSIIHAAVYDPETGRVHRVVSANRQAIALSIADGEAWLEVDTNNPDIVVDVASKRLLDRPPAPSEWHAWDHIAKRWVNRKTPDIELRERIEATLLAIGALEAKQPRMLRELAIGQKGSLERLRALDAEISDLRSQLKA